MSSKSPDALSRLGFIALDPKINPNILLFTPPPSSVSPSRAGDPKLIILFTWLGGATSSRIAVYCKSYQSLYNSPVLLIRTVLSDMTMKTFATVQAQLVPARDYLLSSSRPAGKTLIHVFSNGGTNMALQFSRMLRTKSLASAETATALVPFPVPLVGIILDSCPGASSLSKAYRGAVYSLPHTQPANLLGRACLYPFIGSWSLLQKLGVLSSAEDLRHELNDLNTFGNAPRLYLYSRGDKIVAAEDVESHANELALRIEGVSVSRQVWEFAEHCALPVEDSGKYWKAVRDFVADQTAVAKAVAKL